MTIHPCKLQLSTPSTTANLGPGFDCLGLALDQRNSWELTLLEGSQPGRCRVVSCRGGDEFETIPRDERHLFFHSWTQLHQRGFGPDLLASMTSAGLEAELSCCNVTPLSRGLGSSAALRVASCEAYRRLTGTLERPAWELGAQLEGHPDNAAPAGLGGLVLGIRHPDGAFETIALPIHECWKVVVAIPNYTLPTSKARDVLPDMVPRQDAIFNLGRLGFLLEGLRNGDADLVGYGCRDRLHQEQRASLVPGLSTVMEAAVAAGAAASYLSGAGPTVAAFVDQRNGESASTGVVEAMHSAFAKAGFESSVSAVSVDRYGLQAVEACSPA